MGFYATEPECERREKTHPLSENRVWGFSASSRVCARLSASQVLEPHRENRPTPTKTASGVPYYGYRYLSPELGRWVNRDPIGERGGLNVYGFVKNNPKLFVDGLGLEAECQNCCKCGPIDVTYFPGGSSFEWTSYTVHDPNGHPVPGPGGGSATGYNVLGSIIRIKFNFTDGPGGCTFHVKETGTYFMEVITGTGSGFKKDGTLGDSDIPYAGCDSPSVYHDLFGLYIDDPIIFYEGMIFDVVAKIKFVYTCTSEDFPETNSTLTKNIDTTVTAKVIWPDVNILNVQP